MHDVILFLRLDRVRSGQHTLLDRVPVAAYSYALFILGPGSIVTWAVGPVLASFGGAEAPALIRGHCLDWGSPVVPLAVGAEGGRAGS